MPKNLKKCCAFTGHRPSKLPWKYDENDNRCVALKAVLVQQIDKLVAIGVTDFYTGMALGTDTWAAMAVFDLRERNPAIKLHCVLPCEGQEIKWTTPAQVRYKHILSEADSTEYVSGSMTKSVCWSATDVWWILPLSCWQFTTGKSVAGRLLPSVTRKRRAGKLS